MYLHKGEKPLAGRKVHSVQTCLEGSKNFFIGDPEPDIALWEPTHKNKVSQLRSTPFSTHSGDTRRHQ